jgi:hypothetical protein
VVQWGGGFLCCSLLLTWESQLPLLLRRAPALPAANATNIDTHNLGAGKMCLLTLSHCRLGLSGTWQGCSCSSHTLQTSVVWQASVQQDSQQHCEGSAAAAGVTYTAAGLLNSQHKETRR